MNTHDLAPFIASARQHAIGRRQRLLLVFAGEAGWGRSAAGLLGDQATWLRGEHPNQVRLLLGREVQDLVLDAHAGFDPDAFGAAVGTVRAGGLVALLTPPLNDWPAFADPQHARLAVHPWQPEAVSGRFLRRLARLVGTSDDVIRVHQGTLPPPVPSSSPATPPLVADAWGCLSEAQHQAVAAIIALRNTVAPSALVLTADRGRGKSAALGIAARRLAPDTHVIVTAPNADAAEVVLQHARTDGVHATVSFAAPDALIHTPRHADLLLVDEAAAIPTPLLARLLALYPRVVFATTIHGYEGTGRGFALRFGRVLDTRCPGWRSLHLEAPIRWAADDPVERFAYRALLLDAEPIDDDAARSARIEDSVVEVLDRDQLAADETTLSALFGLLVLAHYRTRPLDLRHLLDGPNLAVFVTRAGGQVVATALVAFEGGFDAELAQEITAGRRRPRGHLLAQSLAFHGGHPEAPLLRYARVVRVAVHPAAQRRGLGRALLEAVTNEARRRGCDLVGASFGATSELLQFWDALEVRPVRLGVTHDAASGVRSVMVLRPLSAAGATLFDVARARFARELTERSNEDATLAQQLLTPLARFATNSNL